MSFEKKMAPTHVCTGSLVKGTFDPCTTFGKRVRMDVVEKQMVAWYIADRWFDDATDAFIVDGSSTFFVGRALTDRHNLKRTTIFSNNTAISTELDACSVTLPLFLSLCGGERDYELNATLGALAVQSAQEFLTRTRMAIASVRQLDPVLGPTAPELNSRAIKKLVLEAVTILVIPLTADKLFVPPIQHANLATTTPTGKNAWTSHLKAQEIYYICTPPHADWSGTNTMDLGMNLARAYADNPSCRDRWSNNEKYAYNAHALSRQDKSTFVEINWP